MRIEPCKPVLKLAPPTGSNWIYEIKWDGYRVAVHVDHSNVRVLTSSGMDWARRFPAIVEEAQTFGTTMILDGEAVVLDEHGRSDFNALQRALGGRGGVMRAGEAILMAFDLLYLDGHDLSRMELSARRHLLEELLRGRQGAILLSEEFQDNGADLFQASCDHGLEGIVAKRLDMPYRSGSRGDWIKVKCVQRESLFIVGYEPGGLGGIGRLLLGAYQGETVVYVGSVGTGFTAREASRLRELMDLIKLPKPAVNLRRDGVVWIRPTLIAEIAFRAWTVDQKLRHASYKGLREVQDNAAVYKLT
jgi:bifunctional non-homologous end joining protein LigD